MLLLKLLMFFIVATITHRDTTTINFKYTFQIQKMRGTILLITILLGSTMLHAQTSTLKGKILSQKAEELAGVTVTLQPANLTTSTDKEGNFQFLKVAAGSYTVGATSVGFSAKSRQLEVVAGKDFYIALSLDESQSALAEVTVVGNRQRGYNAPSSNVATRVNLSLLETPQSIQVVPYQIIRDQQNLTVNDAMKNIAGVQNIAPGYSYYTFRGFDSYNNGPGVITNGIRGVNYSFFQTASLFNVDKIEAIKGPASALYSVGNPGGIINISTKKPLSTNQYEFNTTVDNFGDYRFIGDATGPLDKKKKVLYRLIAGYNGGQTFRDHVKTDFLFLAPSLTFNLSDKTSLNLELNQVVDKTNIRGDRGIVALRKANGTHDFEAVSIGWNRTSVADKGHITSTLVQAIFRHQFSDKLSFTALNSYGVSKNENESYSYDFGGSINDEQDSLVGRSWVKGPFGNKSFNLNYFLNYTAKTGSIKHDLVIGADYGTGSSYDRSIAYSAPDLSIRNPVNVGNPTTYPIYYSLDINNDTKIYGVYVQDVITFSKKLKALVGLRYDGSIGEDNTTFDIPTSPKYHFKSTFNTVLPRLGLVYLPKENLSLYASYTTSYNPTLGDPSFGSGAIKNYKPEGGRQYEAGIKAELLNRKLIPTLAVYHLTKTNVLQNDPSDPTFRKFITIGEVLSKGVELTVQGNLSEAFNVTGFYAYNDVRITKDATTSNLGNRLGNAPYSSANLWAKYNVLHSKLKGLGVGFGLDLASAKVGQFSDQNFQVPGYTNFDGMVNYGFKKYSVAVNVYNVFDTRQTRGGFSPNVIFPGAPRTFRFSLNVKL